MIKDVGELREFLGNIKKENVIFKPYFYSKKEERSYINDEIVLKSLKNTENLLGFQWQIINNEERYRIGIRLSHKYTLVVVVTIKDKCLYIITSWKTSKKWQKAIQK